MVDRRMLTPGNADKSCLHRFLSPYLLFRWRSYIIPMIRGRQTGKQSVAVASAIDYLPDASWRAQSSYWQLRCLPLRDPSCRGHFQRRLGYQTVSGERGYHVTGFFGGILGRRHDRSLNPLLWQQKRNKSTETTDSSGSGVSNSVHDEE